MNTSYRSIWNPSLAAWVAVSEVARARGKSASRTVSTVAAALCLGALGAMPAVAADGGAGGNPDTPPYELYAGDGGADSAGGAGAFNDDVTGGQGGAGGAASSPAGPVAGSPGFIGTYPGFAGAGGAAGTAGSLDGAAGGGFDTSTLDPQGFGGGGGGGYFGGTGASGTNTAPIAGGNGGAGGAGTWAAGGGGAGGYGVVLDPAVATFANSSSITGGNGGAGGNAFAQAGGGGGGGSALFQSTGAVTNTGILQGGSGGSGGNGGVWNNGPSGGGGGGGGNGVVLSGGTLRNEAGGVISGGLGGAGGNAGPGGVGGTANPGVAGGGGGGGDGVRAVVSGATLFNAGSIAGAAGGAGGTAPAGPVGATGLGGVGVRVTGDGNTLVNAGAIAGGAAANAVTVTGNSNTVELNTGYAFTGNVVAIGAGNILTLGGADTPTAAFDVSAIGPTAQYQGFAGYEKTGLSDWTLTGTTAALTPWTVRAGVLQVDADGNLGSNAGALTMDGGTLRYGAGFASTRAVTLAAGGGTFDTNGNDAALNGVVSGAGALAKTGAGTLTLAGASNYTGATTVAQGGLRAGAANAFSATSAHTVAAGATLDAAGFNQTVASLNNSGTVSLVGTAPGTTLTVNGAYVGNGGVLRLGTFLGESGSASDRLVLNGGNASGSTSIQITQLGGLGALTTGDGINVVSAVGGATTDANAFSLAGGHVDAGAYEYRLHDGDASGAGENWYLRSTTTVVPPVDPENPGNLGNPGNPGNPGIVIPTYRAEVPLFAALPAQLRRADLAMLGNMHQRIGDDDVQAAASAGTVGGATSPQQRRAFGRVIVSDVDVRQPGTVAARSKGEIRGFQVGTDLYVAPAADWRAGVYVGQLDGDVRVNGFARGISNLNVGSNDLRNQYLGAYATYANATGFYADTVIQAGRHRSTLQAPGNGRIDSKGSSLLASIEVGQAFSLSPTWKIEPQLQLIHQRQSFDDVQMFATRVQQDADNGWVARAGVRVKGEISTSAGLLQPYGRLNLYKASSGTDIARFVSGVASTDILSRTGGSSAELAVGATMALSPRTSIYGEVGRLTSLGGEVETRSSVQGSIGLRTRW